MFILGAFHKKIWYDYFEKYEFKQNGYYVTKSGDWFFKEKKEKKYEANNLAMTLEEIALDFGVTREWIGKIEAKALRKLRHPSRARLLREFIDAENKPNFTHEGRVKKHKSLEQQEDWVPKYWPRII